ncbi:MAG: tetratricopeptide repeat protein [Nitrospinae bacterium]|nr:tetratricopeptide repeat protein [Nitrospinota bacterium]
MSNPEARIKALEGRLQQYPSSAAFFPLASLLWEKGEVDQAENLLKSGLATYPNYAAAGVLLGEILISKDEHELATRFISKALEVAPWNISGQRLLAECWRKKGDEEAAQVALRAAEMFGAEEVSAQSVMTDSDVDSPSPVVPEEELDAVATPALAELYMAQGHLDKARDVYERLLESEPAKVEWNERLAAIREQISRGGDVDVPTGYPEMGENLDLIAGEVKGEANIPGEMKVEDVASGDMETIEGEAETPDAEFQDLSDALNPMDKVAGTENEGSEPSVVPGEGGVVEEKVVNSILPKIVELYVEEENDAQALDMCRKAQALGEDAPWMLEKISMLERKVEESAASLLPNDAEEDKDQTTLVSPFADQRVVETLEGWLETLQRRKANA